MYLLGTFCLPCLLFFVSRAMGIGFTATPMMDDARFVLFVWKAQISVEHFAARIEFLVQRVIRSSERQLRCSVPDILLFGISHSSLALMHI